MPKSRSKKEDAAVKSDLSFDDIYGEPTARDIKADRLVAIAKQQLLTSIKYKENRMAEIQKSIDLYNGKTKRALKGRWNVPLPIMSGYVDTLLSKTDDAPKVKFSYQDIADMERAAKVEAKWEQDSSSAKEKWALKDRMEKKLASFCGVGISKVFAFNDKNGDYKSVYEVVDYADFECEPMGGQLLRNHAFKGQRNIFKTNSELVSGAMGTDPIYSKRQVARLIRAVNSNDYKNFDRIFIEKTDRLKALGFDPDGHSYVGIPVYNMCEWYMKDPETGEDWYLFFEPRSGIWTRACPLKEVFESDEDPFIAWHTHPDPFNFWSKAPADDMRPVADGMGVIFNQALDNREKKNYTQRAYDPAMFPDPAQLEWRPDGLVEVTTGMTDTKAIGSGLYEFQVADMPEAGTINLLEFMDQITGLKTGITASAQGETEDKAVGIYFGNLQQVADRLGLYNKSYSEAWAEKGLKYYWGLREHIKSNKLMVRMVGDRGYNWVELVKSDTEPTQEFNIEIVGGQAQVAMDELTKKKQSESLTALLLSPNLLPRLNPDVVIEEVLRGGMWEEARIKRIMDRDSFGSELIISKAHQAIQEILEGDNPKLNRSANTLFMQVIIDFATDGSDLDDSTYQKLIDYAYAHAQIATENAMRKVRLQAASIAPALPGAGGLPAGGNGAPVPAAITPETAPIA